MKKLLHLQLLPLLTGVQNFSLHLLDGLPADEFEISVASQPGGDLRAAVLKRGFNYIPLNCLRHPISPLDLFALLQLIWMLKRHKFDIVHTNSSKTGLLGRLAARSCKVPLILHTEHGTAFQPGQSPLARRFFQTLEWLGNKLCHRVVFVNNSDREQCLKLRLLPAAKAVTIYNALPDAYAQKLEAIAQERSFDQAKQDFVIGSTLRFSTQKNVVNLVSAACLACKRQPRLRFILVGEGDLLSLCRQIVRSHGLNDRILFPGWDPDVCAWLKLFDAFILWSRWEAQPFSIIEAMLSGLAVIGSAIPSIQELVDEHCGYLIGLDEPKALIECLQQLPDRAESVFAKGRLAARQIQELCNYQQMMSGYLSIYRNAEVPETESKSQR